MNSATRQETRKAINFRRYTRHYLRVWCEQNGRLFTKRWRERLPRKYLPPFRGYLVRNAVVA